MSNQTTASDREPRRDQIDLLLQQPQHDLPPAFTQAMQSFLTAFDDEDSASMRARLDEALVASQQTMSEIVQKKLGLSLRAKELVGSLYRLLNGLACEDVDEIGRELESNFKEAVRGSTELLEGPIRLLQVKGYPVPHAARLAQEVQEVRELMQATFAEWPWSHRALPPVDRAMVAASRAAIARNEGEPIEDLLHRLRGTSTPGG